MNFFLDKRYLLALSLTLLLLVPFALERVLTSRHHYVRILLFIVSLNIVLTGFGGLVTLVTLSLIFV